MQARGQRRQRAIQDRNNRARNGPELLVSLRGRLRLQMHQFGQDGRGKLRKAVVLGRNVVDACFDGDHAPLFQCAARFLLNHLQLGDGVEVLRAAGGPLGLDQFPEVEAWNSYTERFD